jgi:hypothetical protein
VISAFRSKVPDFGAVAGQVGTGDCLIVDPGRFAVVVLPNNLILKTPIAVAIDSTGHASTLAHAFVASAKHLSLDEFFAKRLGENHLHAPRPGAHPSP